MKTVLLVCTGDCRQLRTRLARTGWTIVKVRDGATAVSRARHENVDAIVLASTGTEMDLTETALNLSDIHPSAEIVLLGDRHCATRTAAEMASVTRALAQARILSPADLAGFLALPESQSKIDGRLRAATGSLLASESMRREK